MKKVLFLGALMALLVSCSDETTYVEYDADPVMVESYKELSDLDASDFKSGTRIFVRDEDRFYSWDGKSWNEIEEDRSSSSRSSSSSDDYDDESSDSNGDIESSDEEEGYSSSREDDVTMRSSSSEQLVESSSSAEESSSSVRECWREMNKNYSYGEYVDERDGYLYRTIEIEGRTWLAENLNYDIPDLGDTADACFAYNDTLYCGKYGRYYTWYAMMNIRPEECSSNGGCPGLYSYPYRGVCPAGWHLPDSIEVAELIELFGGMKAAGGTLIAHSFGFNFLGGGYQNVKSNGERYWSNEFAGYPKGYLYFVSESGFTKTLSPVYYVEFYYRDLQLTSIGRNTAIPVRCVKDDPDEIERRKNLVVEE